MCNGKEKGGMREGKEKDERETENKETMVRERRKNCSQQAEKISRK